MSALRQLVRAEEAERTLPSEWTGDEESLHTVEQAAVALQGMSVTPPTGVYEEEIQATLTRVRSRLLELANTYLQALRVEGKQTYARNDADAELRKQISAIKTGAPQFLTLFAAEYAEVQKQLDAWKGVRKFTDNVIQTLQASYQKTETVDYIGAELFERSRTSTTEDQLLVDLVNRIDADGTVIGGRAYMSMASTVQFCLLRPTDEAGKLRGVSMSNEVGAEEPGVMSWNFAIPFSARAGDYIGVACKGVVPIPYNDADTGNVVQIAGLPKAHDILSLTEPTGRNRRAYSFGVIGYLGE